MNIRSQLYQIRFKNQLSVAFNIALLPQISVFLRRYDLNTVLFLPKDKSVWLKTDFFFIIFAVEIVVN